MEVIVPSKAEFISIVGFIAFIVYGLMSQYRKYMLAPLIMLMAWITIKYMMWKAQQLDEVG